MSVSFGKQVRELAPLVDGLREEVKARAFVRAKNPRPASQKSLKQLQALLTVPRSVELVAEVNPAAPFLRDTGTGIKPKTLRARIEWIAVNFWGFR